MNELAKLTDKILQEAQEAAQRTLQAAREEGEKTLQAARAQGEKEAKAILETPAVRRRQWPIGPSPRKGWRSAA